MLLLAHYTEVVKCSGVTSDVAVVIYRRWSLKMFFKPFSKCSSCLPYVFFLTFQHVTFVSVNYTTLVGDLIFVFGCHKFIFDGFSTFKMNFYAISSTQILECLTKSFMVCDSDGTFACGSIVLVVVLLLLGAFTLVLILLMAHIGYLHNVKASWICFCSFCKSSLF